MTILETDADRKRQAFVANRLMGISTMGTILEETDQFESIDYFGFVDGQKRFGFEIKCRTESAEQVRSYPEGLLVKPHTLNACRGFAKDMNIRVFMIFAFDSGLGAIFQAEPANIEDLPTFPQKPRRNPRGNYISDIEPVSYLDWNKHLTRIA